MQENKQILVGLEQIGLRINKRVILDDITFKIRSGEIVTLIGPNGAGKSSLLKIVLGLIKPSTGHVTLAKKIRIGYMPQSLNLEFLMPMTARRFLLLAPRADEQKIEKVALDLGVEDYLDSPLQSLSGGETQRILLVRALLNEPEFLVLDEPAQGIDINGQAALYQLIVEVRDSLHCGILMVSHDLHLVIAGTDRVLCLNKHICCFGHPSDVTQHPEFIQLFGPAMRPGFAVYMHHHDHKHDLEGNIVND